jgi:signal transduction histidine kinase
VRRFADRFGWTVGIDSQAGVGTRVTVCFPNARCEPLAAKAGGTT